jgi:hypothetical protein
MRSEGIVGAEEVGHGKVGFRIIVTEVAQE